MHFDPKKLDSHRLNENLLNTWFLKGGFIQGAEDQFILFIDPLEHKDELVSRQYGTYIHTNFWDFLSETSDKVPDHKKVELFVLTRKEFQKLLLGSVEKKGIPEFVEIEWNKSQESAFLEQFQWIQSSIQQGYLKKALPIIEQTGAAQDGFCWQQNLLYALERPISKDEFLYGYWSDQKGFIGVTPEVLVSGQIPKLKTMALAGTWPKSNIDNNFSDQKIYQEHEFVVTDILKQLEDENHVSKSETQLHELTHLIHLKTDIEFECHHQNIFSLIGKLHPTAALGMYPRDKALFQKFSRFPIQNCRNEFGAPFGLVIDDQILIFVAIRNFFWDENKIQIFSGCGVTADSNYNEELNELENKRNSIKKIFGFRA